MRTRRGVQTYDIDTLTPCVLTFIMSFGLITGLVLLVMTVLTVIGKWMVLSKLGKRSWAALIPFFSDYEDYVFDVTSYPDGTTDTSADAMYTAYFASKQRANQRTEQGPAVATAGPCHFHADGAVFNPSNSLRDGRGSLRPLKALKTELAWVLEE